MPSSAVGAGVPQTLPETVFKVDPTLNKPIYANPHQSQIIKKAAVKKGYGHACSCVLTAKALVGYNKTVGMAKYWPRNSDIPTVGGVVVTRESRVGHVAVILAVEQYRIYVKEGNYNRCKVSERWINLNNPVIIGYWRG
jgi:surface antigen